MRIVWNRHLHKILIMLAGIVALVGAAVIGFLKPYLYLAPDSFTYFTMARHFYESGMFMSFTGVDSTTGIHIGYYLLNLILYPLAGMHILSWSFLLNGLLLVASFLILMQALGAVPALVAALLMATPYGISISNNGMESSLLILAFSLLAYFFLLRGRHRPLKLTFLHALIFGALLGLLILSRLDMLLYAAGIALVFALSEIQKELSWHKARALFSFALVALIPFALILGSIFSINLHYGGSIMPISGALKSSFPVVSPDWMTHLLSLKMFIAALLISGTYLGIQLSRKKDTGALLPGMVLGSFALFLYNGLFASGIGAWYSTAPFFMLLLAAGLLFQEAVARFVPAEMKVRPILGAIALGTVCVICLSASLRAPGADWITPHKDAALYLSLHASAGETAGELKDGVFAFYSPIPTYSLTGLANNAEYADAVRSGTLDAYLSKKGIAYIIGGDVYSGVQIRGNENLFTTCNNPLYDTGAVAIYRTIDCKRPDGGF